MENSRGRDRVKVVEIPGGMVKFRENLGFQFSGVNTKKSWRVMVKSRGINFKYSFIQFLSEKFSIVR